MQFGRAWYDACRIHSTSLRAGPSGMKPLRMTAFSRYFQIDSLPGLPNRFKLSLGAMPDVEYVDSAPSHIDTENNAIKMWLLAVQEVPEPFVFRCDGTAIGPLRQA